MHMICRQKLRRLEVALIEYRESLLKYGVSKAPRKSREKLQPIGNGYSLNMDYWILMKMSHGTLTGHHEIRLKWRMEVGFLLNLQIWGSQMVFR